MGELSNGEFTEAGHSDPTEHISESSDVVAKAMGRDPEPATPTITATVPTIAASSTLRIPQFTEEGSLTAVQRAEAEAYLKALLRIDSEQIVTPTVAVPAIT